MNKRIIYLDMDDTLCDYKSQIERYKEQFPEVEFPQSVEGFFLEMNPISGAVAIANELFDYPAYEVYILTAPSIFNPLCYTEKRLWVENHLGFRWVERLIIAFDKGLLKGHYLVDDYIEGRGQEKFEGQLIHFGSDEFPNWETVGIYFINNLE